MGRRVGGRRCRPPRLRDDEWGQRIAAVIVPAVGAELDAESIRAFARSHLRGSKTPDVISVVEELPYTETGKLLRRRVLADLLAARPSS